MKNTRKLPFSGGGYMGELVQEAILVFATHNLQVFEQNGCISES